MRIRHLIPTVGASASAELRTAQEFTLQSIERARRCADPSLSIEVCSVAFHDESLDVPWVSSTPPLERSVQDLGDFREPRRLPLLSDVLDRFGDPADFDLAVLTNVDIAFQPLTYDLIAELRAEGYDAMSITRRTVYPPLGRTPSLSRLATSIGSPHPGDDCFAFDATMLPQLIRPDAALGVRWVARTLKWQLRLLADQFGQFNDLHATFHIGDDRLWIGDRFSDYESHNQRVVEQLIEELCERYGRERVRRLQSAAPFVRALEEGAAAAPLPARAQLNRPNDPPHPAGEVRLVFAATSGRSGSEFLAQLLGTAPNVDAGHEREPAMIGPFLRRVVYEDPSTSYTDRMVKVDAIRAEVELLAQGSVYVDTSHMFVKTFADVVLDSFPHHRVSIIALRRNPIDIAKSFMELDYFGPIRRPWMGWMPSPTAPYSHFRLEPDSIQSQFDLIFGYLVDIDARTMALREMTPGATWIDAHLDDITSRDGASHLFDQIKVTPPAHLHRVLAPVNARTATKNKAGQPVSRDAVASAWESFIARYGHRPEVAGFVTRWRGESP